MNRFVEKVVTSLLSTGSELAPQISTDTHWLVCTVHQVKVRKFWIELGQLAQMGRSQIQSSNSCVRHFAYRVMPASLSELHFAL